MSERDGSSYPPAHDAPMTSPPLSARRTPVLYLALAIAALLAAPVLMNAAAYAELARARRENQDCQEPPRGAAAARAFVAECLATLLILCGSLRARRSAPSSTAAAHAARLLVLIPDGGALAAAHWRLRSRLQAAGQTVVECPAADGSFEARTQALADRLAALPAGPQEVVLLGVGTGGLVARHHLRRRATPHLRRLFTVGCPHGGSTARFARALGWRGIGPDEPPLRRLGAADHVPDQFAVTAIASDFDAWILPPQNADYPGAFNIRIRGLGHFGLLASPRVVELLVENLDA